MNNPYDQLSDEQYAELTTAVHMKATASNGNAGCVTVGTDGQFISVQDDKLPDGVRRDRAQIFTKHEFAAFLAGAKDGEFDHLV